MAQDTLVWQTKQPVVVPTERRAWVRIPSKHDILCQPEEVNAGCLGAVRDISSGGLALRLRRGLEPGACVIVELETAADWPRLFSVRVIHTTQEGKDQWVMGCVFAQPVSEAELQALIGT